MSVMSSRTIGRTEPRSGERTTNLALDDGTSCRSPTFVPRRGRLKQNELDAPCKLFGPRYSFALEDDFLCDKFGSNHWRPLDLTR
jgi:hypothetical protein